MRERGEPGVRSVTGMVVDLCGLGEVAQGHVLTPTQATSLSATRHIREQLAQLLLEVVIQPPVQEWVHAGAAHGEDLQEQVRQAKVLALDDLMVEL